jgi:hypothetical protein
LIIIIKTAATVQLIRLLQQFNAKPVSMDLFSRINKVEDNVSPNVHLTLKDSKQLDQVACMETENLEKEAF